MIEGTLETIEMSILRRVVEVMISELEDETLVSIIGEKPRTSIEILKEIMMEIEELKESRTYFNERIPPSKP